MCVYMYPCTYVYVFVRPCVRVCIYVYMGCSKFSDSFTGTTKIDSVYLEHQTETGYRFRPTHSSFMRVRVYGVFVYSK